MNLTQKRLAELRNRVLRRQSVVQPAFVIVPQPAAGMPILTRSRILLSRLGLVSLPRFDGVGIFAGGALMLIVGFAILSQVSSGIGSAKRILGETAVGLEFLRGADLEAAKLQFAKIEAASQASAFSGITDRIPEVSGHIIKALEIMEEQEGMLSGFDLGWDSLTNSSSPSFYEDLVQNRTRFELAAAEINAAQNLVDDLPLGLLPGELGAGVEEGLKLLDSAETSLAQAIQASDFAMALMGGEPKTYMLVFQNNNEARATGGFIGTYGLIELGQGKIKILKIESIYEPDGQLKEKIAAPGPLQRQVSPLWAMRDSNWFADFPASSRKILEFLEKETGVLAEGVISFTPDVFEDLLSITGPIDMPEYGVTLNAENFRETTQHKTSIDYDRELNQPKKFLADFAPRLLSKLSALSETDRLRLIEVFTGAVAQKHLLMFSLDPEIQKTILEYSVGGVLRKSPGDYLAIIHSNVGGGKTDQGMAQSVEKTVRIDELGRQVTTLRITRANTATNELYFSKNVDFMRVFVPAGSKILSAHGFDPVGLLPSSSTGVATDSDLASWDTKIKRDWNTGVYVGYEADHSVFMGWLEVEKGHHKTVELTYELPVRGPAYSLLLQTQPGAREFEFDLKVLGPREIIYQYPEKIIPEIIDHDRFYAVIGQ